MERITEKQLEMKIKHLNEITNNPVASYKNEGSKYTAQVGNYHLDIAYGGYALCQMANASGGAHNIIDRCTKRELYNQITQLIAGIQIGKGV